PDLPTIGPVPVRRCRKKRMWPEQLPDPGSVLDLVLLGCPRRTGQFRGGFCAVGRSVRSSCCGSGEVALPVVQQIPGFARDDTEEKNRSEDRPLQNLSEGNLRRRPPAATGAGAVTESRRDLRRRPRKRSSRWRRGRN